jgi:hypothetical protein
VIVKNGMGLPVSECDACGKTSPQRWKFSGMWFCPQCLRGRIDPPKCDRCGSSVGRIGIEQFAYGAMGSDNYNKEQGLAFICEMNHLNIIASQWGPGAKNAGDEIR